MKIFNFILEYWQDILVILIVVGGLILKLRTITIENAKEWLLYAVTRSEAYYGSGTGAIKLRKVYDRFTLNFKILSRFVSFETFSKWVDLALDELKILIEKNENIKKIIE